MAISRDDALSALGEVEAADARARAARSNRIGASYLFVWGAVWIIGYTAMGVLGPSRLTGLMWLGLSLAGITATVALTALRPRSAARPDARRARAGLFSFLAIGAFVFATYWVMAPTRADQFAIFPPLIVSLIYTLFGSWRGGRLMWIGIALFALSLAGYAFLQPWLNFWLAAVGGGGLVLGGLWMRRP